MSNRFEKTAVTKFPLPDNVGGVCDAIRTTLEQGGVKHIELLIEDRLMRVTHKVQGDFPVEDGVSWDSALRNVETLEEYTSPGAESFQVVVDMMHLITDYKCKCAQWVIGTGGKKLLEKWLELKERGMPTGMSELLGVPLTELKSLPEESLILCGSKYLSAEPEDTVVAIKTTVELRLNNEHRDVKNNQVANKGGSSSAQYAGTDGSLETNTPPFRFVRWNLSG